MLQDLRYAWRSLTARPAFTLLATLTLAIGLGTSVAMYSVVRGVLLEPLPFADSESLLSLYRFDTDEGPASHKNFSLPDLRDVQEQIDVIERVAGYYSSSASLTGLGSAEVIDVARVSDGLLATFGLEPALGRDFTRDETEHRAAPKVVLGHSFWQQRMNGRRDVLGESLEIDGEPFTIIGVAPEGFDYPGEAKLFLPMRLDTEGCGRGCHLMSAVARLAEGSIIEEANVELFALGMRLEQTYEEDNALKRFAVMPLQERIVGSARPALLALAGGVLLVLLISAANVAHLLLARGSQRRRELAVRAAIGASRGRLFGQLLAEGALLAVIGTAAGLVLCAGLLRGLLVLAPPDLPRLGEIDIDGGVLAFAAAAGIGVLALFGALPAWRSSRSSLRSHLGHGEASPGPMRGVLLTAEVAVSLVLLLGAGLLLRSFTNLMQVELGFDREHIAKVTVALPDSRYDTPEKALAFFERYESELASIPGVESVGGALAAPFGRISISSSVEPLDREAPAPGQELGTRINVATPGYFTALRIPVIEGRVFDSSDRHGTPLHVVINEELASRYYPGRSPIGERLRNGASFGYEPEEDDFYTIIGVVADVRSGLTGELEPELWMAQSQSAVDVMTLFLRSRPGVDVIGQARSRLDAIDSAIPLRWVETMDVAVGRAMGPSRFYLLLFSAFAAVAVMMAAAGLYGVVSFLVARRTRELAVRMALGADTGRVIRLVLRDSIIPVLTGVVLGLLGAAMSSRALGSMLHGVTPHDARTYVAATLLLFGVSLAAILVPAHRATVISPTRALKSD